MAKGLFKNFPTTVYDNDGNGNYKQVTDIFRRVSLRNNLKTYTQLYDLQNIDGTQKPDRLANLAHGDPNRNWIVMMMNDVENPYSDWFMSEEEFYNFMAKKYPNKVLSLEDNGHQAFLPGEVLNTYYGTIVRYDPTLNFIVYTDSLYTVMVGDTYIGDSIKAPDGSEPPNEVWEKGDTFIIPSIDIAKGVEVTGSKSNAEATSAEDSVEEMYGPHHKEYDQERHVDENTDAITYTYPENIITNWDYEKELNESRSQIALLDNDYLDRVEDEFKKKIK